MFKQRGISGILQAVRHLLADTMSKQGLPFPGSSFMDFADENNSTSNYLIRIAHKLSDETTGSKTVAQDIYAHMMTIRAQDITAGVVVKLVSELYFKLRDIDNHIRQAEIRLIAYAVNFFGEAVVGCVKQKGVPYVNTPLAIAMATSFVQFCYYNNRETRKLSERTELLHAQVNALDSQENRPVLELPFHETAAEFIENADRAQKNIDELLDYFGEKTV